MEKKEAKRFEDLYIGAHPDAIHLLRQMLQFNPHQRVTVEEALDHRFLAAVKDGKREVTPAVATFP